MNRSPGSRPRGTPGGAGPGQFPTLKSVPGERDTYGSTSSYIASCRTGYQIPSLPCLWYNQPCFRQSGEREDMPGLLVQDRDHTPDRDGHCKLRGLDRSALIVSGLPGKKPVRCRAGYETKDSSLQTVIVSPGARMLTLMSVVRSRAVLNGPGSWAMTGQVL